MRTESFVPVFTDIIPETLEEGKLYVSEKYGTAIHLCACGCGTQTVTPFKDANTGWTLQHKDRMYVTLNPSIGNFAFPCKSHYYIHNNYVKWC